MSIDELLKKVTVYRVIDTPLYNKKEKEYLYQLTFQTTDKSIISALDYVKQNGLYIPKTLSDRNL